MKIKNLLTILSIAIISGFATGLVFSLKYILENRYFQYKMYRLIIFSFQALLNRFVLYFLIYIISFCFLWFVVWITTKYNTVKTTRVSAILFMVFGGFLVIKSIFNYIISINTKYYLILRGIKIKLREFVSGEISFKYIINLFIKNFVDIMLVVLPIIFILIFGFFFIKIIVKIKWEKILRIPESIARSVRIYAICLIIFLFIVNVGITFDNRTNLQKRPNIIWILIDALRADHLGCYGYPKNTSPFIDKFAEKSIIFKYAFSQESYTQASVPSFFTSLYPFEHSVLYDYPRIDILAPKFLTIAEFLRNYKYRTAAFVFNPHLKDKFNFGQGFDLYDDNKKGWDNSLPFYETYETAKKIYDKVNQYFKKNNKRPIFLYLHYRDVHSPYAPPPPFHQLFLPPHIEPIIDIIAKTDIPFDRENIDIWISQYDGEIRYTDFYLKKTIKMLSNYNINRNNSIFIITADHGEEFLDSHPNDPGNREHGRTLYMEQIHVPLIISIPGYDHKIIESYVELNDIFPTILDILKINLNKYSHLQGKSLFQLIKESETKPRVIYSGGNYGRLVIIDGYYKYYRYDISTKENEGDYSHSPSKNYIYKYNEELYNISKDFNEKKNLIYDKKTLIIEMRKKLKSIQNKFIKIKKSSSARIDKKTREQLKALGYIK